MAAHQEARRRREKKSGGRAEANWRPNAKALAAALREIANHLNIAYATCVTVQSALRGQNSDEDTEIEACLRTHVGGAILREVEELRLLAQTLSLKEETA